jgi:probable addiction module antidote protein
MKIKEITEKEIEGALYDKDVALGYLDEILETSPELLPMALGKISKQVGMSRLSEITGLGRGTLDKAMNKNANPTYKTLLAIVSAMGINLKLVKSIKQNT